MSADITVNQLVQEAYGRRRSLLMKHAMKKTLICILALLLAGGCRQEEEKQQAPLEKETAALAGILPSVDPATRTTLHEDGLLTTWESGDAIGVFGNNASNVRYTLSSGAGTPFGLFRGADSGSPVYAYYPLRKAEIPIMPLREHWPPKQYRRRDTHWGF